ncbi:MaoC family dehydratase [Paludisphaera mucosa]|uniref:MaoC/PaaZ C-terminal domain-containing protein n=1 Tax=Paludisphaera mucosa TaxID=3030827 RepID=A0ABT6FCI5_9BACT|nr:MaoC/PaaZ C-terminal domain-containing protein [Paludisphaera mucosa]
MTRHRATVLGFNDLVVGDEWESAGRTVTEADVATFAGLSGDFNALHVDHAWAAKGPFGRPVAHGLLGLALASGLASTAPRMDTLAFLAVLEWKFLLPIAFGDTVRVVSTVESIEPQSRGRRAVVIWRRRLLNQDDRPVQEGRTQTLVRARSLPADDEPSQA